MPTGQQERLTCQTEFYAIAGFPRIVGCIDCTRIKIKSPGGEDGEVYRNRKFYFSINVQLVYDSNLKIMNIVAKWPGSAHDATIFANNRLRTRFEAGEFENGVLLAYLLTPFAIPNTRAQQLYNKSHICTRNTIERTNGVLKRRFPALYYGLRCKIDNVLTVIVATAVLHNIVSTMHEAIPPPPEGINAEELDYLIDHGQIPVELIQQNVNHDVRNAIVNFFANL